VEGESLAPLNRNGDDRSNPSPDIAVVPPAMYLLTGICWNGLKWNRELLRYDVSAPCGLTWDHPVQAERCIVVVRNLDKPNVRRRGYRRTLLGVPRRRPMS
jgi:hypothetical protein